MPRTRSTRAAQAQITLHKTAGTRYSSTISRADGVQVHLEGGSWNRIGGPVGRVPHDLAHYAVEHELAIAGGLWGILAAGGLVKNASFAGGRLPPHATARAREITSAAREEILRTEVLVRAIADASLNGHLDERTVREQVGARWWDERVSTDGLARIDAELRRLAREWDQLPAGGDLALSWG